MRDLLELSGRLLRAGWLWSLVLLALPNCALDVRGTDSSPVFDGGSAPQTEAIMCDFPAPIAEGDSECATLAEAQSGIPITKAAVLLNEGQGYPIALDYSQGALDKCGGNFPTKTKFLEGNFPFGAHVCLNCGSQIPAVYADPTAACIAKCIDVLNFHGSPPEGSAAFCQANARPATNFLPDICYGDACTDGGSPKPGFVDPRRRQEILKWSDDSGTQAFGPNGNSLKRTAPTTGIGDSDFNAGAASAQTIQLGDGWVEFAAGENGLSHIIGFRESCADPISCPDTDFTLGGIGFAISLNNDNNVYVLERVGGVLQVYGPFGTYAPGERFRVRLTDNFQDKASITYARVDPGCVDGMACLETPFYSHVGAAAYPFRVDVTFREVDATLDNVTIVRIKK